MSTVVVIRVSHWNLKVVRTIVIIVIVLTVVIHTDRHWSKYCGQEVADSSHLKDWTRI